MANLSDYLEMRGDITLGERPFNDADNLVLSTLAYLDLTGIVGGPGAPSVRLADACAELLERCGGDLASRVRSLATIDERFVTSLGASARLGGARLRDYVDVRDDRRATQFAAVTAELDDGDLYVAFRGTDTTLAGWRENFILSFSVTEAQRSAASYLEGELARAQREGRRARVGGHSKGGNLAAYATAVAPVALAVAIERVYSNDGPGMDRAVMPVSCHDVVGERYVRIVPAYSVVGRFFSDDAPAKIVASSAARSLQHDPLTWQAGPRGLVEAAGPDPESLVVARAFSTWLSRLALEDRRLLTDELFDALAAGGAVRFEDLLASPAAAQRVLSALGGIDRRASDMMWGLVRELLGEAAQATYDAAAGAAQRMIGRGRPTGAAAGEGRP